MLLLPCFISTNPFLYKKLGQFQLSYMILTKRPPSSRKKNYNKQNNKSLNGIKKDFGESFVREIS